MAEPVLVTQWAVCGIATAAARFVPVPMLDDIVREQALQLAVSRTLRAHDRDYSSDVLEPLWSDVETRGAIRRRLRATAMRMLLFPARKYVAIFGAVRGVPNDVMRVVLLARTLDRRLAAGGLADPARAGEQARDIRHAVDEAIDGMDLRLLIAALSDGLSQGKELAGAAVAYAGRLIRPGAEPTLRPGGAVAAGAEKVAEVFDRPEIVQL